MRAPILLLCLLAGLMAGACSFDPKIPRGTLLCQASPECPRGYSCETVLLAANRLVKTCCSKPGCAELTPAEKDNLIGVALDRAGDAGTDGPMVKPEAGVDAPAGCGAVPSSCPNMGCMKRRLVDGGTCQARCEDDGMQTECVGGDGCCPATCNATSDSDCKASCGNNAVEAGETCDPADTCLTSCPPIGCTLQKLEGSSSTCDAKCVEAGKQTMCASGDSCCPMSCTTANDADCECVCGNGTVEGTCGETCDPLASCPQACPPMGCQLRRLVNGGSCQAQCVNDGTQTMCVNGDGCCPGGCNASNDNDCDARCGNGAVEAGETCDPPSMCPRTCPWNGCGKRKLEGSADACSARCVDDGMQTECASGDGCCPPGCNNNLDSDCGARCGNGVREGSEKCDGADCPGSCPNQGCQRRRLQGSAGQCNAECVDAGEIAACMNGDSCCANGCTSVNDNDCSARCGNGVREGSEKCDGADCPTACPAMGCMRRRLVGNAGQCTAECVADGTITMCANGDGCCPTSCNRNNDNNCPAVCGNGAIEMGETCDPVAMCTSQSQACVSNRNTLRTPMGTVANCTFRCNTMARPCRDDGECPTACMPCGASCGANQDIDCKLPNGSACTHANQCAGGVCTTFFRDPDGDTFGGPTVQVCGTTPPSGTVARGGDCCEIDNNTFPGQTRFFGPLNNCQSHDYNCSTRIETLYNSFGECSDACIAGFSTDPGCGNSGSYRPCMNNRQCLPAITRQQLCH